MDLTNVDEYFADLEKGFESAYEVANRAREHGFDPKPYVEIKVAPGLAEKVEGLTGVQGIAEVIARNQKGKTQSELIFGTIKEICTSDAFANYETVKRIELAVRVALAIKTDGVLVAPTEGMQYVSHYKNADNSDYIAVFYAGPIRSAGGTAVAMSVAYADYARKFFNIGDYRATKDEVERYVEETEIYHERVVPLQYKPHPDEIRTVVSNCPVCIEGVPTEDMEISVHANMSRIGFGGKSVPITNRIRGGVPLVVSSIAQKAKSVSREVKKAGLDWGWLDSIITIDKGKKTDEGSKSETAVFLEKLVAGRPVLAYPKHFGGFRLRYGRSRMTGIAAKGFSPATMIILDDFISIGTQLMIELPGKGCVAAPVDTIEGPFVKLRSGETTRINDAETATRVKKDVVKIISLGDILVTYGDFKKTNTPLQPSSYVEELWEAELDAAGGGKETVEHEPTTFSEAFRLSTKYGVPLHPRFLAEFQTVSTEQLKLLVQKIATSIDAGKTMFEIEGLALADAAGNEDLNKTLELMMVPAVPDKEDIRIGKDFAQSLLVSLGFVQDNEGRMSAEIAGKYEDNKDNVLALVNSLSVVKLMKRSTFIGARIGRPEKAGERLMVPSPNVLFPVGYEGGKERNIAGAFAFESKKFGKPTIRIELARYVCKECGRRLDSPYCYSCQKKASIEYTCPKCGTKQDSAVCVRCGSETQAYEQHEIDFQKLVSGAVARLGTPKLPKTIKGVKGLMNKNKIAEPIEKGILRAMFNVFIFKDGTARFDATDMPITHFYPREVGVSVEKLREMGYGSDYAGNELKSDDQLLELRHQDVILNRRGADYLLNISRFVDEMLQRLYGMEAFYNAGSAQDLVGQLVLTLSPHTSCAVLNRIVGFTDANVGFAHPYTICARRRNADGDEDTTMLLLDALIDFSREYLPVSIGGTMDEPLLLTTRVRPEEVDDEVHVMEVTGSYGLDFYNKTFAGVAPSEAKVELVENRLRTDAAYGNIGFTHGSSVNAIRNSPKKSIYTVLKTMDEKIDEEFRIMDMLESIDKRDAARRLINGHFIRDLIGNLHSFSRQQFRCASCNAKYRRVPLSGKCTRCGGKLLLTISKGSIEKYLKTSINLADRYNLDTYTKQRLQLIKEEIDNLFGSLELNVEENRGQFNLVNFM
ncbi:MAG: DNA polymerase II large subunit [Candidatus Micrarchaeota archaeon]|nr:DNA polymerase II large subunit [Candidatus Micrarchaeota archaeon]